MAKQTESIHANVKTLPNIERYSGIILKAQSLSDEQSKPSQEYKCVSYYLIFSSTKYIIFTLIFIGRISTV